MMRDYILSHPKSAIAAVALIIVLVLTLSLNASPQANSTPTIEPTKNTTITSPVSKVSIDYTINSGVPSDTNTAATNPQLNFFGLGKLPLTAERSYQIHEDLPAKLVHQIIPTYASTYIHVNPDALQCNTEFECAFSFYLDSPEGYYSFRSYLQPDGSPAYEFKQIPFPGGAK